MDSILPHASAPAATPDNRRSPPSRPMVWLSVALGLAGVAAIALAFTVSWWKFILYAPQYPHGLRLEIWLSGLTGDVHEIGMLNHYIGMSHLEEAAPLERHYAALGVALVALFSLVSLLVGGKRLGWLAALPALLFPLGFLADSFVWLYRFGHRLDPHAPVRIQGFTPQMFGNGQIGQFMTFAEPGLGFWLAVFGAVAIAAGVALHRHGVKC
jgi:copper chaperone NosL